MRYDYLIIGAGLSGSTCAYLLQAAGASVLLVEQADVITKSKLCGGMMSPRSIRLGKTLFGDDLEAIYQTRADVMRVIAHVEVMDLEGITMNTVKRSELDLLPLKRFIDLGGTLLDRARWDLNHAARTIQVTTPEGTFALEYGTLIGADGANSKVRRMLVGPLTAKNKGAQLLPSVEANCNNIGAPITIKYEPKLMGYSWYIPCGDSANVGCMAGHADVDLKGHFDAFVEKMGVTPEQMRGAFIPSGQSVVLEGDGFYLLGDAAGLITPPSGEGIFYAMESALQLACALSQPGSPSYAQRMAKHAKDVHKQYVLKPYVMNQALLTTASLSSGMFKVDKKAILSFVFKHMADFTGK